jgi:hypothetical protein
MSRHSPLTIQVLTTASLARFALAVCAAVLLLLLPGTLRAGGEMPGSEVAQAPVPFDSPGASDNGTNVFTLCTVPSSTGFEASGTLLLLQPSSGNLMYATVINPYPLLTPNWADQVVRPGITPAFNVGVRYVSDCGGDVQLSWTHLNSFDQAATASANPLPAQAGIPPPNLPATSQALGPPFLIGPPPPFASANAVAHFAYDAVNLDTGLFLGIGNHVQLRPFVGLQFARVSEILSTNFQTSDLAFSFTDVSKSVFTGVGPRLGMDMHYVAGKLDLVGGMAGAILMGTRQSHLDFFTASPQDSAAGIAVNVQNITSPSTIQVIPCIDARLGASYALPVGNFGVLTCELGYQAAVYFSVINQYTLSEVENDLTLQENEGTAATFLRTAGESQSNFVVHGPYLKFSLRF